MKMYHYSINIFWSEEDDVYISELPDFGEGCKTHGNSYEEALNNAIELIDLLEEFYKESGKELPNVNLIYA